MKYFDELTSIENEIIRLDTLKSLVTVITNGIETTARPEDIENSLWHILGALEDIVEKQYLTFQELFDKISNEGEYIESSEAVKELASIVNGWSK